MRTKATKPNTPNLKNTAGSLDSGEPVYLEIGRVRRPHGLDGDLIVDIYNDCADFFDMGKSILFGPEKKSFEISSIRPHGQKNIIHFLNITSPEQARLYSNQFLYLLEEELPPNPSGDLYEYQLIGFEVYNEQKQLLGTLEEIIRTGSAPVYVVKQTGKEDLLFPAIPEVVLEVLNEEKKLIVKPQEWE